MNNRLIGLVVCLAIGQVQAASFDCGKASTLALLLDDLCELLLGASIPDALLEGRESQYMKLYQLTNRLP
jgi:hypothetical protein